MDASSKQDDPDPGPEPRPSVPMHPVEEPASPGESAAMRREKGRVRFNSTAALNQPPKILPNVPAAVPEHRGPSVVTKPRPSVLRGNSANSITTTKDLEQGLLDLESKQSLSAAAAAQERAKKMAEKLQRNSQASESRISLESNAETATSEGGLMRDTDYSIPLRNLSGFGHSRNDSDQTETDELTPALKEEAFNLVRAHTQRFGPSADSEPSASHHAAIAGPSKDPGGSEQTLLHELNDGQFDGVYNVPPPEQYRGSVLSQLLKLYKPHEFNTMHNRSSMISLGGQSTPGSGSGTATPKKKWYDQNRSQDTLANLVEASARLANPATTSKDNSGRTTPKKKHRRTGSAGRLSTFWQKEEARITVHIAETLSRQEYIIKLCRALMLFGAPTHRLEEYLGMTARVLEIDGQFLYLPGCMIISFDDKSLHTTEVRIVRTAQGIDLGKLKDVHLIYKEVMHDIIGVEEATHRLEDLINRKDKFNPWLRVLIFGLTSVTAAPFSFKARPIDLPLCFCLGSLVGFLQLIVAPKSNLYTNVLEVSATVLVSFLARAFGSIRGGDLFCFSAIAQGGIVMLLPGYMVLCSSLELQSRAMIAGSVRIVYAIIYSLLLGFGITVGATLYGLFDDHATSSTTCKDPMNAYVTFAFVPPFVICISMLYQAKWRQMPVMLLIAFAGYIVNYFSSVRFVASPQIASTLGALSVGVLANLYSRIRHGVAAATLIPAIFTQVPGGLASTGGLLSGLSTANKLANSTQAVSGDGTSVEYNPGEDINTMVFSVAARMIQIAIGIAVGLFMSALIVYPLGKRRSGLFSF